MNETDTIEKVTARCQELEHKLRLAEGRLEAIRKTDMLAIGYFVLDGRFGEPNEKYYEMTGIPRDEASKLDWRESEIDVWKEQGRLARETMMNERRAVTFLIEGKTREGKVVTQHHDLAPPARRRI